MDESEKPKRESIPWGYRGIEEEQIAFQPETRHDPIPYETSPTGGPYRNQQGQWVQGCSGGPGAGHINALRVALARTVTPEQIEQIMQKLVERACEGDVNAAKLVFDRLFGRLPANLKIEEKKSLALGLGSLADDDLRRLFGIVSQIEPPRPHRKVIDAKAKGTE